MWVAAAAATLFAITVIAVMDDRAKEKHHKPGGSPAQGIVFTDLASQMNQFIRYYEEIALDPEQEAIKADVLGAMPAPCCSDATALTCCCPCNLSKATWGLANYLIAVEGYGTKALKDTMTEWLVFTNPGGYSGDACYTGGCERPSHQNGCSGMREVII
jgi:hypothetical protein